MSAVSLLVLDRCQEFTLTLVHVTWTGAVLTAFAAIIGRCLAKRSSETRYWVYFGTLVLMLMLLPICGAVVHVRFMRSNQNHGAVRPRSQAALGTTPAKGKFNRLRRSNHLRWIHRRFRRVLTPQMLPPASLSHDVKIPASAIRIGDAWQGMLVESITACYLAGLCTMLVRLLLAVWGGDRLRLAGVTLSDSVLLEKVAQKSHCIGLLVVPVLRSCERVAVPVVVGTLRPMILIPASLVRSLPLEQLVAVLAHELAHIRRFDHIMLLVQRLVEAALFFHPGVWYLSRALNAEREDCCDDLVVASGSDPLDYATSLLHVAELRVSTGKLTGEMALLAVDGRQPSRLRRRIARVLGVGTEPAVRLTRASFLTLAGVLGSFIASGIMLLPGYAQPPSDHQSQKTSAVDSENEQRKTPEADRQAPNRDAPFAITGRVLGRDGKPFKGAKIYAVIASAESKPMRLKDPNKPPFETEDRKGQVFILKPVHPKVIELFKQLNIETPIAADDPRLRRPDYEAGFAKLLWEIYERNPAIAPMARATSDEDGRFSFLVPKSDLKAPFEEDVSVVAVADGFGPAWNLSKAPGSLVDVQLKLAEDMPIQGRIVDTDGKPVANAKIKMGSIIASPDGTAEIWVETVLTLASGSTRKFNELFTKVLKEYQFFGQPLGLFPHEFTTDADGRFTIPGVGAGRAVFNLEVSGHGIASDSFSVMTRSTGIDLDNLRDPKGRESSEHRDPIRHEYRTYGANI